MKKCIIYDISKGMMGPTEALSPKPKDTASSQTSRIIGKLRRVLSEGRQPTPPVEVTRNNNPDNSFTLKAEVDGKVVLYMSDHVYSRAIWEPGPIMQRMLRNITDTEGAFEVPMESHAQVIGIHYPDGTAKAIYRDKDTGVFSVEYGDANGQTQKVTSLGKEHSEGITPEASKGLLATSIREYKDMTHLLGVKEQERSTLKTS